jgi:acetylglutamate kinase
VQAPCIRVKDVRLAMPLFADLYYNHPSGKLGVVGVTGTKGKSSTTYYLKYILDEYLAAKGSPGSGVISSIDTYDGAERFESHLTTPEPLDLERHFANAADAGMEYLTMEVSSQALKYDRVVNVEFAAAVFLNISADHISPWSTRILRTISPPSCAFFPRRRLPVSIWTATGPTGCWRLPGRAARGSSLSQRILPPRFRLHVRKSGNDILFRVKTPRYLREFRLTMPGLFNVENALAAITVCEGLGIPEQHIYVGLMKARVPGRMEIYTNADDRVIAIVDYAHNRLSFEKLFQSVREEYPGRRIVTVFGCPGKKALDRRRDLGEISGRYSDLVVLTEEDAGEEPVEDICREIAKWVEAEGCEYSIRPDRGEAIEQAIESCEVPSVVLITGKGAETRQKRGIEYIEVPSDVAYTQKFLHSYDVAHGLDSMDKVRGLLDILPRLEQYKGRTIVVKYGGSALEGGGFTDTILQDVAALRSLGADVVLVHGGGRAITALLSKLGVQSRMENGYRVTDEATLAAAELVLSAQVNKAIVTALGDFGVNAVGISGKDGGILTAACKDPALGRVGEITRVDTTLLKVLLENGYLPVLSPIAMGEDGRGFNCNADDAACAVAEALRADKLVFLTDTDGILVDHHNRSTRIPHMDAARAAELLEGGLIAGGMAPKVKNCVHAATHQVSRVLVLDGRVEHALLLEAVSQKALGTTITKD